MESLGSGLGLELLRKVYNALLSPSSVNLEASHVQSSYRSFGHSVLLSIGPWYILGWGGGGVEGIWEGNYYPSQYSRRSGLACGLGVVFAFVLPVSLGIRFWAVGLESTCRGSAS